MSQLSTNNIEAELSYAYLHAVAASAGVACQVSGRHHDNAGVDAQLTGWAPFPNGGYRDEVDLNVQLKATVATPALVGDALSYSLRGIDRYDALRSDAKSTPRILVVLFLPSEPARWLVQTDDALSLQRCAYWVSLRGAGPSTNSSAQTVYLPKSQLFSRDGLLELMGRISRGEFPMYTPPEVSR
ncbi:DUF4365 domain-containing protein [Nannocystis sp. SCPEA4]|uniref:DUF4365 domain-containing protein n=1 Tax=Nannocystis sp. SCPEA4 TaxID=2996787 RepID=UPI00226ED81B|nr:DUF4365 domain-containing protein [Nannocystis sp. SCPEA4]MCY1060664.1 DUF4365 domain-containing protein [Nannocystis sp. SCPEA4]